MSLGRRRERQEALWVSCRDLPESPGNPFYEKLNGLLDKAPAKVETEAAMALEGPRATKARDALKSKE